MVRNNLNLRLYFIHPGIDGICHISFPDSQIHDNSRNAARNQNNQEDSEPQTPEYFIFPDFVPNL